MWWRRGWAAAASPASRARAGSTSSRVEFLGGTLANLPFGVLPEPAIWVSRGTTSLILMEAVPDNVPGHWRLFFDLTVDGQEPVDMRVFLRQGDTLLSETWLYLFEPATLRNLWPS